MKRVPLLDLARQYRFMESDIRAAVEACLKIGRASCRERVCQYV
jgi:hypothetical protein